MSDIVPFERSRPRVAEQKKSPTLEDCFGRDYWMLKICAEWRVARAQQERNWAEHNLKIGWGNLSDEGIDLDVSPLDEIQRLEFHISQSEPRTVLLARELLGICVKILAYRHEDPEHVFAEGPVLNIVRNVINALEAVNDDMRIGDAAREKRKRRKRRRAN